VKAPAQTPARTAVVLTLTAIGCGGNQTAQLQSEIRGLRDEIDDLKRSQAAARVQFDEFRNRMVMIEERIDTQRVDHARRIDGPATPESAWIPRLPTVKLEPPSAVEVAKTAGEKSSETGDPAFGPSGPADDVPPQQDGAGAPKPKLDPAAALYTQAKAMLDQGQITPARTRFENLHRLYPDHELADNALYWIGESFYAQSLWLKAAQSFLRVCKEYPRANKVPDAMLKLAKSYGQLGDDKGAQDVLRQLARQYPTTPAGQMASAELAKPTVGKQEQP
jgi:tol-pal system protein YbgF